MPMATFLKILMGFFPIYPMNLHTKFEVPEIRGVPQKIWAVPGYALSKIEHASR